MKRPVHIFWYLYTGTLLSLAVIAFLTLFYVFSVQKAHELTDFLSDVKYVVAEVRSGEPHNGLSRDWLEQIGQAHAFSIMLPDKDTLSGYVADLEYLDSIEGFQIYRNEDADLLIAITPFHFSGHPLVVSDIDPQDADLGEEIRMGFEAELREERLTDNALAMLIGGIILALALFLSLLLFWLKRSLTPLFRASDAWRKGELECRVDENQPEPFASLTHTLNKMAEDLQRIITEQKVMTQAMSHELRNPLNGVAIAMELVKRKHNQLRDDPVFVELERYVEQLESLTLDVLELGKISNCADAVEPEQIQVDEIILAQVERAQSNHPGMAIVSHLTHTTPMLTHPLYINRVVDNLLSNAVKYAKNEVNVRLYDNGEAICLVVEDDGPGMEPEFVAQALFPFSRGDKSRSKASGGFGLGLAIVDACVNRLGGKLTISNKPEGGLCVMVFLPGENGAAVSYEE